MCRGRLRYRYQDKETTVLTTDLFDNWIRDLKDLRAKTKIQVRIRRLKNGNFGDIEPISDGFSELRIHEGQGYRVYLKQKNNVMVILLSGRSKGTQQKDIIKAKQVFSQIEGELWP
ncbi:TPA: type II toxin-antitoxin system RelE/ParE family toxin [Providencia rettgeri]|uniref:type II toxin-antitoxin system RelE/ParE family toxin n=1 Tax=Providencia sp. TaxID=589 RepID=UPI0033413565